MTDELDGRTIFLVEDEYLVAVTTARMLKDRGAERVVTAHRLHEAIALAQSEEFDAAILDVNLAGERSEPVADILETRGIPYLFATGYSRQDLGLSEDMKLINKPYTPRKLTEELERVMKAKQE
ncbi:MAG: response regulator [Parvularcula sp.]|nr:response regulator [Parvularcula sp.]